jgi:phospholipase A1/A2
VLHLTFAARIAPLRTALLLVASACVPSLAVAAADCVNESDPTRRLSCYDRLHGRTEPPMPVPPAAAAPAPDTPGTRSVPTAKSSQAVPRHSVLSQRWDLDDQGGTHFAPRPHRPVYLLPATWTDHVNRRPASPTPDHTVFSDLELKSVEAKYQISLKAKFGDNLFGTRLDVWGGYTQSSRWQLYNGADSRPFRETNYEPELILTWPMQASMLGWQWRLSSLSLNHQSNGRALPLSRSWNRVIATAAFERGDWVVELRPWWRLRERPEDDDNPDLADYIGRGELSIARYVGDHAFTAQLRHSLRGGDRSRGSVQLDWVFPLTGALHGYLQVFSGYGESLVDYNLQQTKWGLGVTIAGWR